ncbi:hypothetical protein [Agrobacterium cavarae]|uniref:hypothetical protein n=1 Tax=Agrobacterium cavarae TaxID=2528239 RepID=UPI0028AACF79|nr:hypothetical protein [Agrobacterium cavarae]
MVMLPRRVLTRYLITLFTIPAFFSHASAEQAKAKQQQLDEPRTLDDQDARQLGYVRLPLDLGNGVKVSFLAKENSLTTPQGKIDAVKAPGRAELAKVFVPDERDNFEVTVSVLRPGFAAEAPSVSEQLLMENGYGITDADHASLTSADARGQTLDQSKVQRTARSLCQVWQDMLICFFMEGDAEYGDQFANQAEIMANSLSFDEGPEEGFASSQIEAVDLPLGSRGTIALDYPSEFSVASNDFKGDLPGTLQLQQGSDDDPLSVIIIAASAGSAPPNAEAVDSVADQLIGGWLKQNEKLFANPALATKGDLAGLGSGGIGRSYAYIVDKLVGGGGQAQVRLSLFASGGVRYSVLIVTHYSPKVDETEQFFARLGGITGYDLVMQSILHHLH